MKTQEIELYTFEEARSVLRTSKAKMRMLLKTGQVKSFKIGKNSFLIPKTAVEEFIMEQLNADNV